MAQHTQKSIELFFQEYGISDPDLKAKLLPELTDIIYNYNKNVVQLQKAEDDYKKSQFERSVQEYRDKIDEIFTDFLKKHKS